MSVANPTPELPSNLVPRVRPRRLRRTAALRELVRETQVRPADLILPLFISAGANAAGSPQPVRSMPGVQQHTTDSLLRAAHEALDAGVRCVDLFGVPLPEAKDPLGSQGLHPKGILNQGLAALRAEFGDELVIMADTCLDEFTSHGHCGVLDAQGQVDNDATLALYGQMAVAQAAAGAHMVSPSGMMDGQVAVIRAALDAAGFSEVPIMAYAAKYASAFYGPFRDAVDSTLEGDRRSYQQDPANRRESQLEVALDLAEGADIVMVKPGLPYLDVLQSVAAQSHVPVAAYHVSGEYAMVKAAAAQGWIDEQAVMLESLTSLKRAGADMILTYFATAAARIL